MRGRAGGCGQRRPDAEQRRRGLVGAQCSVFGGADGAQRLHLLWVRMYPRIVDLIQFAVKVTAIEQNVGNGGGLRIAPRPADRGGWASVKVVEICGVG